MNGVLSSYHGMSGIRKNSGRRRCIVESLCGLTVLVISNKRVWNGESQIKRQTCPFSYNRLHSTSEHIKPSKIKNHFPVSSYSRNLQWYGHSYIFLKVGKENQFHKGNKLHSPKSLHCICSPYQVWSLRKRIEQALSWQWMTTEPEISPRKSNERRGVEGERRTWRPLLNLWYACIDGE